MRLNKLYLVLPFLSIFVVPKVTASSGTFYFHYEVTPKPVGEGTVYASLKNEFNPTHDANKSESDESLDWASSSDQTKAYPLIHLSAKPNESYGFKQWIKTDANGKQLSVLGNTRKLRVKETVTSSSSSSRDKFYYQAVFDATAVSVSSAEPDKCQAYIDKEINSIGDKVILTAITNNSYYSIAWRDADTQEIVSTSNPYVIDKITQNAHYEVITTESLTKPSNGYYRIRNVSPNSSSDYLRMADNWFDMTEIVGSATTVQLNPNTCIDKAKGVLARDLKLTKNQITDPATIAYVKFQTNNTCNLIVQGTTFKEVTTGTHHGDFSGNINYSGCYLNVSRTGDAFSLFASISNDAIDLGNFYFYDNNGTFSVHYADDRSETLWYLEPVNSGANYFSQDFSNSIQANGKYYTTARMPFKCKIPSGSNVKAYSITAYPSAAGDLPTMEVYSAGGTIPAGLPVVIESSSNNPLENKLLPTGDPSNYISSTATNTSGVTNSITTVLYNKYGTHAHDNHNDQATKGDGVGYFSVAYSGSAKIYKLGVNDDGVVGFWDEATTLNGNEAYATQPCALFPVEKTLADIAEDGKEGISYDVIDNYLYGVRVVNGKLYAKDYGKYRNPNTIGENEIDGMGKFYDYSEAYDQSNWVALDVDVADASEYVGKNLHVIGKLINRENPEIKVAKIETSPAQISSYELNVYSPASFTGTQESEVNDNTYFFVQPKPQELAQISWAVYGGNGNFYVNSPEGGINTAHIKGGFHAEPNLLPSGSSMDDFKVGKSYKFDAVINIAESTTNSKLRGAYVDGGISNNYVVYPLSSNQIVTGTTTLETRSNVTEVKYYNAMGVESSVPFNGVNIVVTTYDNGTRSTSKVIR